MATAAGSTAAMNATLKIGSEVSSVGKDNFNREKLYQATMSVARKMLSEGLISEEEYRQIDTIFLAKYQPVFGTLFSGLSLTL